jgi:hypothetical protein
MRQQAARQAEQQLRGHCRLYRHQALELSRCCCFRLLLLKVRQPQLLQLLLRVAVCPALLLRGALHAGGYQVQVVLLLQLLRE